jgi:hypothetical protein
VIRVAEPKLAVPVVSPALDLVVVEKRASEGVTDGKGASGAAGAEVHGQQRIAHLAWPVAAGIGVAEPERSIVVASILADAGVTGGAIVLARAARDGGFRVTTEYTMLRPRAGRRRCDVKRTAASSSREFADAVPHVG